MCLLAVPANAKYSGGTGEPNDPYQIATAADLIALGETPDDYDKHFILTADIDLDPNLPGRKVFDKAVIAPRGTAFTGVFDGKDHTISHLTITGKDYLGLFGWVGSQYAFAGEVKNVGLVDVKIAGTGDNVGGLAGDNEGSITNCYNTGSVSGIGNVGGLVGLNSGSVVTSYSTASVRGTNYDVGGLAGRNIWGSIVSSCSKGSVSGTGYCVGGLVGSHMGFGSIIASSYSSSSVSGTELVGGLVGDGSPTQVTSSFWDTQTSGQTTSVGGTGKTTAEMQTPSTFLEAGWDFVDETGNGTEDTWWINEGKDYPRLSWDGPWAHSPDPKNGEIDVVRTLALSWLSAKGAVMHDVYFAPDEDGVARATHESLGIYRGRQPTELNTYDPNTLEWSTTYYWRIDEVNDAEPGSPWKGSIWRFTTMDFLVVRVVDDFESYTDDMDAEETIWQTWIDGLTNQASASQVGYSEAPFAEVTIVHGGTQSMPLMYDNSASPFYSEAERIWDTPQDWTTDGADALALYFRGDLMNMPDPLYVGIEDSTGRMAAVVHADAKAAMARQWRKWHIDLAEVQAAGVDLAAVRRMVIGVGDRNNPNPGGAGTIYIDDIRLTKRVP
jgi:hypothetical protein